MDRRQGVEFILGGVATCGAVLFTNPLDVIKTRMQLQGELKSRGQYAKHYRNAVHALWTIGRHEGLLALQRGLVPGLWFQFFMNGTRLGLYQVFVNQGLTRNRKGDNSIVRSVTAGALAGCLGSYIASPFYLVKTHLQTQAVEAIAVGHQHPHQGMAQGLRSIYTAHGIVGLWRGVSASIPRLTVGSAAQLSTFSASKDLVVKSQIFPENSWVNTLAASMVSGVAVTLFMTPFDVVSTRLYNQGVDSRGRGLFYSGTADCFLKMFRKEGVWAFYKGWAASFLRLGPHTVLTLVFWDELRKLYLSFDWPKFE